MAMDDEALNRALIMAGLGMMGSNGSGWQKLAAGGMYGLEGYDSVIKARELAKIQAAKLLEEQQQAQQRELQMQQMKLALEAAKRKQAIYAQFNDPTVGAAPAPPPAPMVRQPSVVDDPSYRGNPLALPPSRFAQGMAIPASMSRDEQLIRMLARAGDSEEAKKQLEIFKGLEGEVYGEPQLDKDGRVYVTTKRGPRYVDGGFVPRDKLVEVNLGGQVGFRTEFDPRIRATLDKTLTPGEVQQGGFERQRIGMDAQRLQMERDKVNQGQYVNEFSTPNGVVGGFVTPSGFRPVPGGAPQDKLSESQGAATAYGMRASSANDLFNEIEKTAPVGSVEGMLANSRVTNTFAPDWAQRARQAKLNFMSATLRKESGAVISPSEYDAEDRKYFPQPGEGPEVAEQKRQARELAIKALAVQAGTGAKKIGANKPAPSAGPTTVSYGGKTYSFPSGAAAQAFKLEVGIQ